MDFYWATLWFTIFFVIVGIGIIAILAEKEEDEDGR